MTDSAAALGNDKRRTVYERSDHENSIAGLATSYTARPVRGRLLIAMPKHYATTQDQSGIVGSEDFLGIDPTQTLGLALSPIAIQ